MADFDKNRFNSKNQDYSTPMDLFKKLDNEFHFTLDVCADESNKKVDRYFSEEDNALTKDWQGSCWMNPPYKDLKTWVKKAYEESRKGAVVCCLIPARTNTKWWLDYASKGEVRFIIGRPKFDGCVHGLPQPLVVVIFGEGYASSFKNIVTLYHINNK
jgi:phage N-6-adenine-methyltransferase